ncbi:MAG: FAD-dependent oxidoreductase [Firmicutes bacterium]|nr:FAD-dependent oxidoreductase [Bacillota bacterium]
MKEVNVMKNLYDVVIVGGGPAGLTAALYLARAKYRVVVVEKEKFGGQITITHEVVNYPGVARTSGAALTETMRQQAESFGAEFMLAEVEGLDMSGDVKKVMTSRGELQAFGVLLATGAHPRMVGFKGEDEYRGRGVAYCATCDGEFFTGKDVFVVGGGFAAAEEAVFLTKYARQVSILIRRDDFSCAASAADHARSNPKIQVLTNTVVDEVSGDGVLRKIRYTNKITGETTEYSPADGSNIGVFVFAGYAPETSLVKDLGILDEQGYVITDRSMKTSVDGLYAAGDVCIKALRQVVTAVGDGALAATELEKYAAQLQAKTGLKPQRPEAEKPAAKPAEQAAPAAQPASGNGSSGSGLFDEAMMAQLNTVFGRMANPLILKLYLDERPVSAELKGYMEELAAVTEKLTVEVVSGADAAGVDAPCVRVCRADGSWSGLAFHGVPGGHEFTSFVLGLYNAAGPGQPLDEDVLHGVRSIAEKKDVKILVSLACTMCPELVTATQRLAAENEKITAEVYDINHFPALKDQYNVMSVPCLVINDGEKISFGKKNAAQVLELLK